MNNILLETLNNNKTKRPPVWFMRQAGRILPSYQKMKTKYTFSEMMEHPDLAAEVTLLPLSSLDVDAVILFSDILVVPQALGLDLEFKSNGPIFHNPITTLDSKRIFKKNITKLDYIYNNIDKIKSINNTVPLIGFCGGPLTVFCFMFRGVNPTKNFNDAIKFLYEHPKQSKYILNLITEVSEEYVEKQINHGINCFQLFETYCGLIPQKKYESEIMPFSKRILQKAKGKVPTIFFPKDYGLGIKNLNKSDCDYVSIDWQMDIFEARKILDNDIGIQGNIDPRLLYSSYQEIDFELNRIKKFGLENNNWIINLGHGFLPDINYEKARYIVDWVKNTNWSR
mgnify:FL=1